MNIACSLLVWFNIILWSANLFFKLNKSFWICASKTLREQSVVVKSLFMFSEITPDHVQVATVVGRMENCECIPK